MQLIKISPQIISPWNRTHGLRLTFRSSRCGLGFLLRFEHHVRHRRFSFGCCRFYFISNVHRRGTRFLKQKCHNERSEASEILTISFDDELDLARFSPVEVPSSSSSDITSIRSHSKSPLNTASATAVSAESDYLIDTHHYTCQDRGLSNREFSSIKIFDIESIPLLQDFVLLAHLVTISMRSKYCRVTTTTHDTPATRSTS